MAEINQQDPGRDAKVRGIRSKKSSAKVDLTAMVDLAFLLITFFMLTTSLSQPKSMDLTMPDQNGKLMPVDENKTMTILLGNDNQAKCFMGKFDKIKSVDVRLKTSQLRHQIMKCQKEALSYSESIGKSGQGLIVLIKPGKESNYGNLVDVLDEMAINDIQSYAIVDIDTDESEFIEKK